MPDLTDQIQEQQAEFNAAVLAEHNRRNQIGQQNAVSRSGEIFCLDCEEPIPPARLAAQPNATRCTAGQTIFAPRRPF